jgi:hypothetical protein
MISAVFFIKHMFVFRNRVVIKCISCSLCALNAMVVVSWRDSSNMELLYLFRILCCDNVDYASPDCLLICFPGLICYVFVSCRLNLSLSG